jgi:hypothetical protein
MPEQIYIEGNTYTLGATVGPVSGTGGSTSYFFGNLNDGQTYYFVVVSYNYSGFSGYAGPLAIYTPPGEIREPINVFAWDWPYSPLYMSTTPSSLSSTSTFNRFGLSNQLIVSDVWSKVNSSNIGKNQNPGSSAPPEGIIPYAISSVNNGDYIGVINTPTSLSAGQTYTYSFYHLVTGGVTGLSYRIITNPGNQGGIKMKQISPDVGDSYSLDDSGGGEKALRYGTGLTGWQRFGVQFIPGSTQTDLKIYVISKTFTTAGLSAYIAGPQLTQGETLLNFIETGVVADWEGNCAAQGYTYNDNLWLNESSTRGWTYVSPMVNFSGVFARKPYYTTGWTLSQVVQRAEKLLKQLPEKKRAILPVYYFTEAPWYSYSDGVSFDHGTTYTFYKDLYETVSTQKLFPTIWPVAGVSMAKESFSGLMQAFAATGATVDYLISNMELFSQYGSFSIIDYPSFKNVMVGLTQYGNSYLGLTGFSAWMESKGATIGNIGWSDQITRGDDYLVWEGIQRGYINRALDEIYSSITNYYPNSTRLEYEWSYLSEGEPLDGAPDINGHPQWFQYIFGNVAAPQIYGWMGGIAAGSFGVCGYDPTYLYFNPGGGNTLPVKNAWTSFLMGVQTVRSAKRGSPNTPITPWIASVRFPGGDYAYPGGSADAPQVGFADMSLGYNEWQGFTLNSQPGNSAYYFEMVRHVALHGVKAFPYWNTYSFVNQSTPNITGVKSYDTILNGDTGYVRDITDLNNVLGEINQRLGGFTLTTADTARLSWISPYIASGAPGLNGTTWWWRITANPDYVVTVDNTTILSATGPGMWLGTTGPTLGVSISSSPVLAPL